MYTDVVDACGKSVYNKASQRTRHGWPILKFWPNENFLFSLLYLLFQMCSCYRITDGADTNKNKNFINMARISIWYFLKKITLNWLDIFKNHNFVYIDWYFWIFFISRKIKLGGKPLEKCSLQIIYLNDIKGNKGCELFG